MAFLRRKFLNYLLIAMALLFLVLILGYLYYYLLPCKWWPEKICPGTKCYWGQESVMGGGFGYWEEEEREDLFRPRCIRSHIPSDSIVPSFLIK